MERLNQLLLVDESRLGFVLIIAYILIDVAFGVPIGDYELQNIFGSMVPAKLPMGGIQLALLILVAAAIGSLRAYQSRRRLHLQPVSDVDPALSAVTMRIGQQIARGVPQFMVTSNILDTNAFCLPTHRRPWVILGGGIRRLLRRHPGRAHAVIAHECAHVKQGDAAYLMLAVYIFMAYAALNILSLLVQQVALVSRVPLVYDSFLNDGSGLLGLFRQNLSHFLVRGFPGLISVFFVGATLLHFVRVREFRADELAGLAGFRNDLIDTLSFQVKAARPLYKRLWQFHPTVPERLARLSHESNWGKLDVMFVLSMAFVMARLDELLDKLRPDYVGAKPLGLSVSKAMEMAAPMILEPANLLWIAISFLMTFVIVLHVYRVSATQLKLAASWDVRMRVCIKVMGAVFIGTFVASLSSNEEIQRLILGYQGWSWEKSVDYALYRSIMSSLLGVWLAFSLIILTPRLQKKHVSTFGSQMVPMFVQMLGIAFVAQFLVNIVGFSLYVGLHLRFPRLDIAWLPNTTENMLQDGMPNLLQFFLTLSGTLLALQLLAALAHKIAPQLTAAPPKQVVHSSRLIRDAGNA